MHVTNDCAVLLQGLQVIPLSPGLRSEEHDVTQPPGAPSAYLEDPPQGPASPTPQKPAAPSNQLSPAQQRHQQPDFTFRHRYRPDIAAEGLEANLSVTFHFVGIFSVKVLRANALKAHG